MYNDLIQVKYFRQHNGIKLEIKKDKITKYMELKDFCYTPINLKKSKI